MHQWATRISPWGEILGTWFQVIYSTPPLKEAQSRQQALPEQGLELMKHQLSMSFPPKKLKRKFTLMIVLRTSRKQTSLLCKFHRFSQKLKVMIKKKNHLPQNQPLRHTRQVTEYYQAPNLSEEESRCVAVVQCQRSADRCASCHCKSLGFHVDLPT